MLRAYWRKDKPHEGDYLEDIGIYLFYWKYSPRRKEKSDFIEENLGDYLSKVIITHFSPKNNKEEVTLGSRTLYAVGSIIGMRCQDAIVWGSGILDTSKYRLVNIRLSNLNILAVRGPKTRQKLLELGKTCPEVYGDPAILMPQIFMPDEKEKRYKITLIPHYADKKFSAPENVEVNVLDIITTDYKKFITEICQSELVISSSLHGIILAETYGVPAILLLSKGANTFKYEDWYNSTGRYNIIIANSIEEAVLMKPMELPDLSKMQESLLQTFPLFLWE